MFAAARMAAAAGCSLPPPEEEAAGSSSEDNNAAGASAALVVHEQVEAGHTAERELLQALYDDKLMESDLRKQLRRFELPNDRSALPGELRGRLIEFLQERLSAQEAAMEEEERAVAKERAAAAAAAEAEAEAAAEAEAEETVAEAPPPDTPPTEPAIEESAASTSAATEQEQLPSCCTALAVVGCTALAMVEEERCAACFEELNVPVMVHDDGEESGDWRSATARVSCEVCGCTMHARCCANERRHRGKVWCQACKAVGVAVSSANARLLGWAPPDLFTSAEALRRAAQRVPEEARAAAFEQAALAAERTRRWAVARGAPPLAARARAFYASRGTSERLLRTLDASAWSVGVGAAGGSQDGGLLYAPDPENPLPLRARGRRGGALLPQRVKPRRYANPSSDGVRVPRVEPSTRPLRERGERRICGGTRGSPRRVGGSPSRRRSARRDRATACASRRACIRRLSTYRTLWRWSGRTARCSPGI